MYGVVLWCSPCCEKAVIWCEDHGDLAFFHDAGCALVLEAGDLVKFRSEQTRRMRLAKDLTLVEEDRFRDLPERLRAVGAPRTGMDRGAAHPSPAQDRLRLVSSA